MEVVVSEKWGRKMSEELKLNSEACLPLREIVFHKLRDAILQGRLKPGERLMELQLASELGVSRTPVREAIRKLENEGLAITVPRKGAQVAAMTEKDMQDVLEIREVLDGLAVETACDKINGRQLTELTQTIQKFESSIQEGDLKKIAEYDVEFHDIIYEATDNPKLVIVLNNLREQIYRYRIEYLKDKKNYPDLIREHREILTALKQRNKESVKDIMRNHIRRQAEAVKDMIRIQSMENS